MFNQGTFLLEDNTITNNVSDPFTFMQFKNIQVVVTNERLLEFSKNTITNNKTPNKIIEITNTGGIQNVDLTDNILTNNEGT